MEMSVMALYVYEFHSLTCIVRPLKLIPGHLFFEVTLPFSVGYFSKAGSVYKVQLRSCLSQQPLVLPFLGL